MTTPTATTQDCQAASQAVFALILTGPPGAGKTSVLAALADALSDADVPHATLEVEALRSLHPPLSLDEEMHHLRVVCDLFRHRGHRTVIIARTIEDDDELAATLRAVDPDEHLVVRLEANPATLEARILAREPPSWSGLQGLVAHAQKLAASMRSLNGVGLVLSTEHAQAEDVADRVIAHCPAQLGWTAQA